MTSTRLFLNFSFALGLAAVAFAKPDPPDFFTPGQIQSDPCRSDLESPPPLLHRVRTFAHEEQGIYVNSIGPTPGKITYIHSASERQKYLLRRSVDGLILNELNLPFESPNPLQATGEVLPETMIVLTPERNVYLMNRTITPNDDQSTEPRYRHTSPTAGSPLLFAGTIKITGGRIRELGNDSGHYFPSLMHLRFMLTWLRENGFDLSQVFLKLVISRTHFLTNHPIYISIDQFEDVYQAWEHGQKLDWVAYSWWKVDFIKHLIQISAEPHSLISLFVELYSTGNEPSPELKLKVLRSFAHVQNFQEISELATFQPYFGPHSTWESRAHSINVIKAFKLFTPSNNLSDETNRKISEFWAWAKTAAKDQDRPLLRQLLIDTGH